MVPVQSLSITGVFWQLSAVYLLYRLFKWLSSLRQSPATKLRGPAPKSFLTNYRQEYMSSEDGAVLYEAWEVEYGSVFTIPWTPGQDRIVLADPKAVAHFFARDTLTYVQSVYTRALFGALFGKGILTAEGETHKRQRKVLTPAFSNTTIRKLTSVFYDSAYKLKGVWDDLFESTGEDHIIVDVQKWMNRTALDSIGIAGFSHDFRCLDSVYPPVERAFDQIEMAQAKQSSSRFSFLTGYIAGFLAPFLPIILRFTLKDDSPPVLLRKSLEEVADDLWKKSRSVKSEGGGDVDHSIIGLLIKADSSADSDLYMTKPEIVAQNVLILGGYMTTSISLTWALIELTRNPATQIKLRDEILDFYLQSPSDPTYDQLLSPTVLPLLDAVVHEILRLHPPVAEAARTATEDDIVPLYEPITTSDGKVVERFVVKKGQTLTVPIRFIARSEKFWGEDAKVFRPERWLEDDAAHNGKARQLAGHRHILTFADGPRACLGKGFALAEFKAVLATLVRHYTFEFPDGPGTRIVRHQALLPRPKVEGFEQPQVPLKVKRVA